MRFRQRDQQSLSYDKIIAHILGDLLKITTTPRRLLGGMYLFDKCARIDKMLPRTVVALHLLQRPVSVDPVLCLNCGHDQRHWPYLSRGRFRSWPLQPPVELASNSDDLFCVGAFCVQ